MFQQNLTTSLLGIANVFVEFPFEIVTLNTRAY